MTLKVLIAEDHELYRDGLRLLLQQAFADIQIIEAGDFSAVKAALLQHPDLALVLLDIQMPGTSGLSGLEDIKRRYPALPTVIVSTVDQYASIRQMLHSGADGFIAKTSSKDTMLQALMDIMAGDLVIITDNASQQPVTLSPRQIDILKLLVQGLSNKEMASTLDISAATVREHVSAILLLLDSSNRTQAALKARQLGFILD
ncbi:response regulator [Thalassolituus sp. LLYu03]|uniref:response regulator n=1 Tax=Thalassolituus sp. LLYu03 TaxID=3421656 RepID=UPI003D2A33BF